MTLQILKELLTELTVSGASLRDKLVEKHLATPSTVDKFIETHFNCAVTDITTPPSRDALNLIPEETARFHNILPLSVEQNPQTGQSKLLVAAIDPTDYNLIRELRFVSGHQIELVVASRTVIRKMIDECYGKGLSNLQQSKTNQSGHRLKQSGNSPVVKLVNDIVLNAIRRNASDIHFEPFENDLRVRFRIDGLLQEMHTIPNNKKAEVLSRIKIMASLDIAEKRRPQDGRIRIDHDNKSIDIRVSTLPTGHGEKIVLRILDKSAVALDLTLLGMDNTKLESFKKTIARPYGMVLVTGPTGSGKTTTLYAALSHIKSPTVNISTVEDPIEYHLDGINQTQMKAEIGFTFASALRTLLRQDPNIIMVGEIRDRETADIAIRSSLTGHLVLSTLHTNDAPSAVTRLLDMGIEPFLIASSVTQVIAQRLVRRICNECKEEVAVDANAQTELGLTGKSHRGKGCSACGNTGYKGRLGLYEVMTVSESIKQRILDKASASDIRTLAIQEGMTTLRDDGIAKIKAGVTTVEEVLRETIFQT